MIKTKLPYALTFLSGLLLGWLLIGWLIWPVAYVGEAYTYELNQADKLRYASAVVDSFALTGQSDPAWFAQWTPEEVNQTLEQVAQSYPAKANWARALGNLTSQPANVYVQSPAGRTVQVQNQASEVIPPWLVNVGFIMAALGLIAGGFLFWRNYSKRVTTPAVSSFDQAFISRKTEEYIPVQTKSKSTPLTTARLEFSPTRSNDQYFPIEREGEQVGEFGVSQVADQPAWDVWLHDQEAIVTITKVLANQPSEELSSRGEVITWGNGPFTLDTPNLKLTGKALMVADSLRIDLSVEAKNAE